MIYRRSNNSFTLFFKALNQIPPAISLLIAFVSLLFTYQQNQNSKSSIEIANNANLIAKEALAESKRSNKIAQDSKVLSESTSILEKRQRSSEIVDKAYDEIYKNDKYKAEIDMLTQTHRINNVKNFKEVMDVFENLGVKYCNGLVYKSHLLSSFYNTLSYICDNPSIVNNFNNKKNSAAMLCYELMPEGIYSKTVNTNTVKTCQKITE